MEGDVLTGETIRLVPVVLDEAAEWLAGEDEEQIRWFDAPRAAEMPDVIRAINEWQASWRDMGPVRHWGIRPLDSNLILGGVEVRDGGDGDRSVNLSFLVFPPYRRQGIAVEASRLALDYAVREMGATHALIKMAEENSVSLAVARRLGAIPIGTDPANPTRSFLVTRLDLKVTP
jgi:RimJ/RimL family protein N-acetyltransferase